MAVLANVLEGVIFDPNIQILFAVGGIGLDRALGHFRRQSVGRHGHGVINAAGDDGSVGIAFKKLHNDFLADARDLDRPPLLAGPLLGNTHPAGGILVPVAVAIPVKLQFHAAIFVSVDLLPGGADHDGGLRALHDRFGRQAGGAELLCLGNGREIAGKEFALRLAAAKLAAVGVERYAGDKIIAVLVVAWMFFEAESASGDDAARVGLAVQRLVLGLDFVQAHAGEAVTFAGIHVFARIVIHFKLGGAMRPAHISVRAQRCLGFREIEIVQGTGDGLRLLFHRPIGDDLPAWGALFRFVESNLLVTGIGAVRADGVGQNERVLAFLVLEKVVNAFLFHQSADEIEIRLAILDTIFARGVGAGQAELVIVEAVPFENRLDNGRGGHGLKYAAIGRAREKPEPRHNDGAVTGITALVAHLRQAADKPVEITVITLADAQTHRNIVADDLVEIHLRVLADEFGLNLEHASELFAERERTQRQHILIQWRAEGQKPRILT